MRPCHFRGQDRVLEAPADHNHREDGEILGLPVKFLQYPTGEHLGFRSVWKPDAEQLAALNAGGGVILDVWGAGQPPVALSVCPAEDILVEA